MTHTTLEERIALMEIKLKALQRRPEMKMDKQMFWAWLGSVWKWIKIAFFRGEDRGYSNCPLCKCYQILRGKDQCAHCPVFSVTGKNGCENTPYTEWTNLIGAYCSYTTSREQWAAIKELGFLLSLPLRRRRHITSGIYYIALVIFDAAAYMLVGLLVGLIILVLLSHVMGIITP